VHEHIVVNDDELPYTKKIISLKEEKILNDIYVNYVSTSLSLSIARAKNLLEKDSWLTSKDIKNYNITKEIK